MVNLAMWLTRKHLWPMPHNHSQPAMGRGISLGARMQPVATDLQEGPGDPNKVSVPEGFSLWPSANPHQTHTIPILECQAQESNSDL